jgi:peptidoglycan/xylan/chitin deacetylase (PgdA/CDA1 family)
VTTAAFLTIDTEFAWRHHAAGLDAEEIYARSLEPAGVGLGYQLAELARHDLKACFFVDPMPALLYGIEPIRRMVSTIRDAGQEVQLHLHPAWTDAVAGDGGRGHGRFDLSDHDRATQRALIVRATDLLVAAGAPHPIAFRAGSYAANDDTLAALAALGFAYDSSHNGAAACDASRISLSPRQIAPVAAQGLIEIPVTVIEDRPGQLRTLQLCALSANESRDALEHAAARGHVAATIVSHGFELANRQGTRANAVHVRRFEALCATLAELRTDLPTRHFRDRPPLALGRHDRPLARDPIRRGLRQAEQLWSNWVEERA